MQSTPAQHEIRCLHRSEGPLPQRCLLFNSVDKTIEASRDDSPVPVLLQHLNLHASLLSFGFLLHPGDEESSLKDPVLESIRDGSPLPVLDHLL